MSNQECIIDTNAIINMFKFLGIKERINELVKENKIKLVVCEQVFYELSFRRDNHWPGYDRSIMIKLLTDEFGNALKIYAENNPIKIEAKLLEEKYKDKNLHSGDSVLLAILIHESWDKIITNDYDLKNCCKSEKIKIVFDPKPHSVLKAYNEGLKKVVESERSHEEVVRVLISNLFFVWDSVKHNHDYIMNKVDLVKYFNSTTYHLGKKSPRFKEIRVRHEKEPEIMDLFLEKIDYNSSYPDVMHALDSVLEN